MKRKINWRRGLLKTSLILSLLFVFFITIGLITDTANASKQQKFIEVKVKPGDSLWTIADRYDNNKIDLRKLIYEIKKANGINHKIYPGEILIIPIY